MLKWVWAGTLLAVLPGLLCAQERPANAVAVPTAFELDLQAPDEIRTVLAKHLELLRYRELPDLSDSELARLLSAARPNILELVATLGYFSPDIRIEQLTPDGGPARRTVRVSVAPGASTLVQEVRIEFSSPMATDPAAHPQRQQIEASWSLRPGMRFTQARWDAAKQQALRQLNAQRYPTGQIGASQADIDPASHAAHLRVTLDSGPPYRLGGLLIRGLQRHDAGLVTRLVRLTPGTDYDQAQLVQAQQRLTDSGYFDSAFVSLDTAGDPQAATVQVQLREAPLKKLVLGIGASTDSGARLSVEHTHHRLPGIGWRALSKLTLDRETRAIGTELTAPPDEDNWRWATAALLQKQKIGGTDIDSQRLRLGRSQSSQRIDRNYYLQYDRADTLTPAASTPIAAAALSANYAFTVRHFDSLPFPSSGWGLGLEFGGGTTLGSQREPYGRLLARWLAYQPLPQRVGRLALRAEAGAVLAHDDINLPSTQLFLTGGDNSVRGYSYRDIGVTRADGHTAAGRYLTLGSVEWQYPITSQGRVTDWEGTLFLDAGAVADKPAELHAKVGVGVGARWKSPVGPLQIDLAYGVAVQRLRLHLNVGFTF